MWKNDPERMRLMFGEKTPTKFSQITYINTQHPDVYTVKFRDFGGIFNVDSQIDSSSLDNDDAL